MTAPRGSPPSSRSKTTCPRKPVTPVSRIALARRAARRSSRVPLRRSLPCGRLCLSTRLVDKSVPRRRRASLDSGAMELSELSGRSMRETYGGARRRARTRRHVPLAHRGGRRARPRARARATATTSSSSSRRAGVAGVAREPGGRRPRPGHRPLRRRLSEVRRSSAMRVRVRDDVPTSGAGATTTASRSPRCCRRRSTSRSRGGAARPRLRHSRTCGARHDGEVVATAAEFRFGQWFGGRTRPMSGIWGVATLPEHRGDRASGTRLLEAPARGARDAGTR